MCPKSGISFDQLGLVMKSSESVVNVEKRDNKLI